MPKRKLNKIEKYENKLRKLKQKVQSAERKRIRVIESSDSDNEKENEQTNELLELGDNNLYEGNENPELITPEPVLDTDVINALGEASEDNPKFGNKIHDNLAQLWLPILKKGMDKEAKGKLLKQHKIPENCTMLQAPKLNPEISAAVTDSTLTRDKRVESVQQQLGVGITALNKGLELLLDDNNERLQAVKYLSESCRILCDLHHIETEARRKFVTPSLDRSFLNIIQDVNRDDMLFGHKLSEKIKASKVIEKQGLQIKKFIMNTKPVVTPAQPMNSRPRHQGNWAGPSRYQTSSRGGRGGFKKSTPMSRKSIPSVQSKPLNQPKQRAPTHRY